MPVQQKKISLPSNLRRVAYFCTALLSCAVVSHAAEQSRGYVARAMFTTAITEREPADQVLILDTSVKRVYFFSDVRSMQGHSVFHNWKLNGHLVSSKEFAVNGPRWRIYSEKDLAEDMTGTWTVTITDERGWPMKVVKFEYQPQGESKKLVIPATVE